STAGSRPYVVKVHGDAPDSSSMPGTAIQSTLVVPSSAVTQPSAVGGGGSTPQRSTMASWAVPQAAVAWLVVRILVASASVLGSARAAAAHSGSVAGGAAGTATAV